MSSCITCPTFYNYYSININIKNLCVHIIHLCLKPKSYLPHNIMYSHVLRHQDFLLFSKPTYQRFWAPSQLCKAFTHDLCAHSNLKTAGALWGHTKTGRVNNTEIYAWGTSKIPYNDNAIGSKIFTKCGWVSSKEELGESNSNLLSCQTTIFSHWMKQLKEFQEKRLNLRKPERTDTQSNLNMNEKAWKNAEMITIICSRRKLRQMKKKEKELYHDTASLISKSSFGCHSLPKHLIIIWNPTARFKCYK